MNFKLFKILILTVILFSCKSQQVKSRDLDFKTYCADAFKKELIEKDPLILLDGKSIGLLSEIDFDNFEFKIINSNSITIIPKGSEYLKRFWGDNATNGIIEITKYMSLHCGKPPKRIYLLNDKEVDWKQLEILKTEDIKYWTRIDDIIDFEKNAFEVEIIITNK